MAGAKRVPVATVAASKPGLRPRTALGDIGNKVSEQLQAKGPLKKVTAPSPSPARLLRGRTLEAGDPGCTTFSLLHP